ncbi:hypothetical protein DPMN_111293 [Dreissena polymorpha]|uniref:Uncharacterized protein n=1 Tax=Dreissena polymorpha TaxID=45954 RepID=A0A9D4KE10_DREPO|nr:hypothetical protein DPMN_111284 [Dreissena polymorpha]KAH3837891.1 hypothetical protein DPMN_111293 [Dreissena polymorpha]
MAKVKGLNVNLRPITPSTPIPNGKSMRKNNQFAHSRMHGKLEGPGLFILSQTLTIPMGK